MRSAITMPFASPACSVLISRRSIWSTPSPVASSEVGTGGTAALFSVATFFVVLCPRVPGWLPAASSYGFAIGISTWTNLIAAGPIVTTQIAGKMQNTSGNTIFTPVFAAASSAR